MSNQFYQAFDFERYHPAKAQEGEIRNPFEIDRDRIIFSYSFRRLQSKTQVFQSGEFDFYRTRLTHSIEVSKIARSLVDKLNRQSLELTDDFYIDPHLAEASGLAHDLGHPPFGHIGERKLNESMEIFGGFEGNGQTLRILTQLFYDRGMATDGMNPTRALIDSILKYKHCQADLIKPHGDQLKYPYNHFIYDEDRAYLEFVNGGQSFENLTKSLECQIMDWADDIAYSINDIIDSIQVGYLSAAKIEKWAENAGLSEADSRLIMALAERIQSGRFEGYLNKKIGEFIHAAQLQQREHPLSRLSNRYAFELNVDTSCQDESKLYKRLALELIFHSPQIQKIEFKGAYILEKLFQGFVDNYLTKPCKSRLKLLPTRSELEIQKTETDRARARIICDHISEMTDSMAIRTYKQLFDPEFGSILDLS